MKIEKVRIKNINSLHGVQEINFLDRPLSDTGLFAITGDTGAGKTTILDAITLGLYGRVHRNKDVKEVLSHGAVDCFAEVEFSVREERYRGRWDVHRARNKVEGAIQESHREISIWNAKQETFDIITSKKRDVDKTIEQISGLDFDRFCRSVLLSQGDFAAFLKADEKERSDLLERITGTEIYSQLGQAAFQRHKEEKEKLENLQRQQTSLRLLDKEEVKEKKAQKKELDAESKKLKTELESLRGQLQWWKQMEALQQKKEKLTQDLQQIEQQKQTRVTQFTALDQHLKILPFVPHLIQIKDGKKQLAQQNLELQQLEETIAALQERMNNGTTLLNQTKENLVEAKKENKEVSKKIAATQKLDVTISEKEKPIVILQEELILKTEALKNNQEELNALQTQTEELLKKEKTLELWLQENNAETLSETLAEVSPLLRNIDTFIEEGKSIAEELKTAQQHLAKDNKEKEDLEKRLDKKKDKKQRLEAEFKTKAPEHFASNPEELLQLLANEIETLSDQRNNLLQFNSLFEDYQNLLREQLQYEDKLENLRITESQLNNQVLTSLDLVDAITERLEFKHQIYEQQQLIANYDRDRTSLKPGMPCPVCQSTDHPFRHKHFKPFVNQAKLEYEKVRQQYDDLIKHQRQLLIRQERIAQEIEYLAGTEGKELGGQVQQQLKKILNYENKIASVIPILSKENIGQTGSNHLQNEISKYEINLVKKKELREQLTNLKNQLLTEDQQLKILEENQKDQQRKIDSQQERIKFIEEKRKERLQKYQDAVLRIDELFAPFKLKYDHQKAHQQLETLKNQKDTWDKKRENLLSTTQNIKLNQQSIVQKEKEIDKQQAEIKKIRDTIEQNKIALQKIKEERFTLLEDRDPEEEKNRQEEYLQKIEDQKEQQQQALETISAQLKNQQGQQKALQKALDKLSKESTVASTALLAKIIGAGFNSIEAIEAIQLSEQEAEDLKKERQELEKNELEKNQSLKDAQEDLQQLIVSLKDQPEQEALLTQQNDLDQKYQDVLQQIGGIETQLNHQKQLQSEAKELLQQIEDQRKEFNRWANLNDLIGSADGKKFRVFAQGLTLKKLSQLANKHLKSLDGRYWIEKRGDENLELDIIDTYQAGNQRSMNTLSGGESFLVSLALALGLSDLAGRNTNIQSLFIDEGFGTLDDSSLDLAITTLENLQTAGKTIGVISHVKELKERISTQIQVKKMGNGVSKVEVVG